MYVRVAVISAPEVSSGYEVFRTVDSDSNGVADILEDIELTNSLPFTGTPFVVTGVMEAEQFDIGGEGVGYHKIDSTVYSDYRTSKVLISSTTDLGLGYCIDQMK